MDFKRVVRALAVVSACAAPAAVEAQGFGLNEIGTCALSRGFAATAMPCNDGSAIYWNPGATMGNKGWTVYAGAAAVALGGEFAFDSIGRVDEADAPVEVPPHLFVSYSQGGRWSAGVGVYVPYGLTSQWREDFPGRFLALKASLATVYVQPNFAYEVIPNRLSIGGGPVFGHSTVELVQGIDLAPQVAAVVGGTPITFAMLGIPLGTEFGRASLEGDANAWGFNLGAQLKLTPTLTLGARYLSQLDFEYENAAADFRQINTGLVLPPGNPISPSGPVLIDTLVAPTFVAGVLTDQTVDTRIDHPAQAGVGLAWTGLPNTLIEVDYAWVGWESFKELPVQFDSVALRRTLIEDYENSWSIRTGISYSFRNRWQGRAGLSYVKTPAPDETVTPLLPDQDRMNYNIGVGIPIGERFLLDVGYLKVDTEGRRGRIVERESRTVTAEELNTGFYTLNANIFSLSLRAQF